MSELTKDQVVEFLSNLTVIELSNLVSELEEKWGVSAAAAVAVAAGPAAGGEAAEEKTEFDIILKDASDWRIRVSNFFHSIYVRLKCGKMPRVDSCIPQHLLFLHIIEQRRFHDIILPDGWRIDDAGVCGLYLHGRNASI